MGTLAHIKTTGENKMVIEQFNELVELLKLLIETNRENYIEGEDVLSWIRASAADSFDVLEKIEGLLDTLVVKMSGIESDVEFIRSYSEGMANNLISIDVNMDV